MPDRVVHLRPYWGELRSTAPFGSEVQMRCPLFTHCPLSTLRDRYSPRDYRQSRPASSRDLVAAARVRPGMDSVALQSTVKDKEPLHLNW